MSVDEEGLILLFVLGGLYAWVCFLVGEGMEDAKRMVERWWKEKRREDGVFPFMM